MAPSSAVTALRTDRSVVFTILLATVALVPLPLGAIYRWSWAGLGVIAGLALLAWGIGAARGRTAFRFDLGRVWVPLLLFAPAVAWALVQTSDLTPASWHHPIWAATATTLEAPPRGAVSLAPYESGSAAVRMLSYGALFWLFAQYGRSDTLARRALAVLVVAGALYAAYGIVAELSGSNTILWFEKRAYQGSVTSTFANRNIYAAYAGLGFLCALALALKLLFDWIGGAAGPPRAMAELFVRQPAQWAGLALAAVTLLSALMLTGSRGGAIATVLASVVLLAAFARKRDRRTRRLLTVVGLVVLALSVLFFAIAGAYLGARMAAFISPADRLVFDADLMAMIAGAPWQGYGAGAYLDAYYLHTDPSYRLTWNYAHNLYLQLVLELGIPAAAAALGAVVAVCVSCWRGLARRRRNHVFPALGLAATTLVGVHGFMDDPLIVPAVAATYSALLGLGFAQSWSTATPRADLRD